MSSEITNIAGVGSTTAAVLSQHKFSTVASVANTTIEELTTVPGFSVARAEKIITAAKQLLNLAETGSANDAQPVDESAGKPMSDKQLEKNARKVLRAMLKGRKKDKTKAKGKKAKKDKKGRKNKKGKK